MTNWPAGLTEYEDVEVGQGIENTEPRTGGRLIFSFWSSKETKSP